MHQQGTSSKTSNSCKRSITASMTLLRGRSLLIVSALWWWRWLVVLNCFVDLFLIWCPTILSTIGMGIVECTWTILSVDKEPTVGRGIPFGDPWWRDLRWTIVGWMRWRMHGVWGLLLSVSLLGILRLLLRWWSVALTLALGLALAVAHLSLHILLNHVLDVIHFCGVDDYAQEMRFWESKVRSAKTVSIQECRGKQVDLTVRTH